MGHTPKNGKPFVSLSSNVEIMNFVINNKEWEDEIPNDVLPLIEDIEDGGELTLEYVIKQCEWIMESSESGVTFYGDKNEDEGVAEVARYLKKYKK